MFVLILDLVEDFHTVEERRLHRIFCGLTDVTEFKLLNGKKAYLSAILDLHDKSIVAYALGQSNNNQLVFDTFDRAVRANPSAHPLFHSDRGCQYTNRQFKAKLDGIHATQSMSRPGRCIDNGPTRTLYDGSGQPHICIDEYMKRRLQIKLIHSIVSPIGD